MRGYHMKEPEVLSAKLFTTPDGTKALYATIKFKTRALSMSGNYTFVNKNGKRLFIAGYTEDEFESFGEIVKSLTFK